jgi:outer membrane lipoprotein SlyB
MNISIRTLLVVVPALLFAAAAGAQQGITYGRVTEVRQVPVEEAGSRTAGRLVGGTIGVMSGSGKSGSNKALRGIAGARIGGSVAGNSSRQMAYEYTVLVDGTSTVRMLTDSVGMRVGDCVAVERGQFNNLRLMPDDYCTASNAARPANVAADADACVAAKQQLLEANTDADFNRAERRVRALCN